MLKFIRRGLVCLTVLFASAYAPPAYAASASVTLTHIQAGGVGVAVQEFIAIYNNSLEDVDVTDWCLRNKSNMDIGCFLSEHPDETIILPPLSYATVVSLSFAAQFPGDYSLTYSPTNQSSGSIVGSADTITLVDREGQLVDTYGWTSGLMAGMWYVRSFDSGTLTYDDTDSPDDWNVEYPSEIPVQQLERHIRDPEEEPELPETGGTLPLLITEILPNAVGSDTANEFIELYNPNEVPIPLEGYVLWYGPELDKSAAFPAGSQIGPRSYKSFTNAEMKFSLLNTSSRLRILSPSGEIMAEVPVYENPKDGQAWALIDGVWTYTDEATPGEANILSSQPVPIPTAQVTTPKACAPDQYRNPETNRCRKVESAAAPKPCKEGQYRSEETGRCRNVVAAAGPAPCKEGQERNPETGRCRKVPTMTQADYGVLGVETSNSGGDWYMWAAIGGLLLIAIAYAAWEWRAEILRLYDKTLRLVRIRK